MTDTAAVGSSDEETVLTRLDPLLLKESRMLGLEYKPYSELSKSERGALLAKYARGLRTEAKRRGIDGDEFVSMTEEARERVRAEHPIKQKPPKTTSRAPRSLDDVVRTHAERAAPPVQDPPPEAHPVAPFVDEELMTTSAPYSPDGDVPATEADPVRRDKPTLGEVRPAENDDLIGWVQPRNLLDVYARYTIGDGQHFIRVERIDPKVWQQIPCSGLVGEVRTRMSEEEFHAMFGGRVYVLQVYGPDTKGRRDPETGLPLIKPKTEPFRYTVPMLPPSLRLLPSRTAPRSPAMHPFAMSGTGMPTTPADAQMHKTTMEFMSQALNRAGDENRELRKQMDQRSHAGADVLRVVEDAGKTAIEQSQKAADAREQRLLDQLRDEREARRKVEEKLDQLSQELRQQPRESSVKDVAELMKVTNPGQAAEQTLVRLTTEHQETITRLKESHKDTIETLKSSHKEALEVMKTRQEDELKQMRIRLEDVERSYRDKLAEAETRHRERETSLRDEIGKVRTEERASSERREREIKEHNDERIKDLRAQNERDLRMQSEQHTTRVDTVKSNLELQITNQKERIKRLEEELAEAREELSEAKDPVAIVEKQEQIAKSLGFTKKDDNAPQTPLERFGAMAGMGFGKMLEDFEKWGPEVAKALRGGGPPQAAMGDQHAAMARQGLQPGRGPRPQMQPGAPGQRPAPRSRAVQWASANSIPVDGHTPTVPPSAPPVAHQGVPAEPAAAPAAQPQPAPEPQPSPPAQAAAQPQSNNPNGGLSGIFSTETIQAFRKEVERAIDGGMPADMFAGRFVAMYPDAAMALATQHKHADFIAIIAGMEDGAASAITRRDGKKWVEKLWEDIPIAYQRLAKAAEQAQSAQAGETPPAS